jgi:hypothetical protein
MKKRYLLLVLPLCCSLPVQASVLAPVLKWKEGGCYSSWCETGWYSSPAVADLDGNGTKEIIASAYSVVALEGTTGNVLWRVDSGKDRTSRPGYSHRTWPGIWISDIDGDSSPEIITAHSGGYVSVYNNEGYFKPGWPKRPTTNELRGLTVNDIDRDGTAEIIVTGATYGKTNTWVYEHNGVLRSGWPQLGNSSGSAYGVFNDNAWVDDLDGDGKSDIVVPSDVTTLCAYGPDGVQLDASAVYGDKKWGTVGTWESLSTELRGWGRCNGVRSESYRSNFAHGASVIADVDGDGTKEVVVTGNMYNCQVGHPPGKYTALFIFNADRSRFKKGAWDWEQAPVDTGAPLTESYSTIENAQPNPVVVDLDGDRKKEILFASYDGKMHAYWLDKTEHDNWPYSIYRRVEGFYRFASEPVVADLDRDGCSEVIFTSWVQKTTTGLRLGKLHVLDCKGNVVHEQNLPRPKSLSRHENGALPAPTIANIDSDPDYELVINTINSGFIAYDLPGSAGAKIQWRSGRNRGGSLGQDVLVAPVIQLLLNDSP